LQCLLCGGVRHCAIFDDSGIDILRCEECGHVFSSFRADPHYDGFWGDEVPEQAQFYWSQARARMHRDFLRRFLAGRSGKLLDMGCGLGFFVRFVGSQPGWQSYGCEISPAAVQYARDRLGLATVQQSRLEDADLPDGSFDIITIWDVIDHILQPDALLARCHALLKPGGVCFIRTPNVTVQLFRARLKRFVLGARPAVPYLQARNHAHHYSMSTIRRLLNRNGFPKVDFTHLHPIGGTTAGRHPFVRVYKSIYFETARAVGAVTAGSVNLDNLFVVARREI
jgi:2-polyprenyl-3-methyl-5-hydroxy-6-metoxy-1,4-benzoquinol methylase